MSNVQQSVEVDFNVKSVVSDNAGLVFNVDTTLSAPALSLLFNTKATVSQSSFFKFNLLSTVSPVSLLNIVFKVLQTVAGSLSTSFSVLVPVGSPPSLSTPFNVRAIAQQSSNVVYNVGSPFTIVQQSVTLQYGVMISPGSTTHINAVPINPDSAPPQYVTTPLSTSLLGG